MTDKIAISKFEYAIRGYIGRSETKGYRPRTGKEEFDLRSRNIQKQLSKFRIKNKAR